ncbi:cation:proton antiporter [Aromatoleum diolicum]|uniref:Sodium:proton antiporter n=1 Tax=Aromatoleum diolicum TaxID=75796 RepID=A0ABX1QDA2_9RHOO|nr:cation:proton antiporter [Aromatoleum diolicum]NMG75164.1 sodium:proton antiporter [Aromatoleum diolicum]
MDLLIWPEWPLRFGALFHVAVALVLTALTGEAGRRLGVPRVTGYAVAGLVLGPLLLGWFDASDLASYRSVLDLTLALLLFELGIRLDLRWFAANPWVVATSLAEIALTFILSFGALWAIGTTGGLALAVAAIAVGTSPVIVMHVTSELRAAGQTTDRLLALCALNAACSVILFKLLVGGLHGVHGGWHLALLHPLYLLVGSILAGALIAGAYTALRKVVDPASEQGLVATVALLLAALAVLTALRLPAALAPLIAGALIKWYDPRPHLWPQQFGSVGGVLVIVTFMLAGSAATSGQVFAGVGVALVAIAARVLGKLGGTMAFGPASGLDLRKSLALGVALMPLSVLALLLAEDVRQLYPAFGDRLMPVVLAMTIVLSVLGPIATRWALVRARESRTGETS